MDPDATQQRPALPIAGDFELVRKLGAGGFGAVFEARHRTTGLPYAVKRILLTTEDADRFRKEALYPARIASQSLHVLSMHSFFQDENEGYFYVVTELIPHGDLRRFMATQPSPLPVTQGLEIGLGIARGLAAIHEQGIIHRDMKPGNILMDRKDERWVPKIADFGLARSSDSVSIGDFASSGYAAPEQVDLAAEPRLGPESDMFSYGMVLYELLTGERGSQAKDLREYSRWAQERRQPPPPSSRRPELAGYPELDDMMARLLDFDPDRRTITSNDVTRILAAALHKSERQEPAVAAAAGASGDTVPRTAAVPPLPPVPATARPATATVAATVPASVSATVPATAPATAAAPGPATPVAPPRLPATPARPAGGSRTKMLIAATAVIVVAGLAGAAWFNSSASGNTAEAAGLAEFRDKQYTKALPKLLDAAKDEDAPARAALGRMYLNGWGVERDYGEARKWLDRAAAQGNADARCALGDMYRDGAGVEKRPDEAFKRYTAAQDAPCGQVGLGQLYLNGLGVPANYDEALRWYEKAADRDKDARTALQTMQNGWRLEPLFAGPWRNIGGKDRRSEIDHLRQDGVLARVGTTDVRRLRRLDVDFYDGASIFELEVGRPNSQLGVLAYIRKGDRLVMIDGRAPQIHDLSASAPIRIDTIQRAIAFLRFFMGAIQGDGGIFRVIDTASDLHWLPTAPATAREPQRLPIRQLDVEPSPAGGWRAKSTIGYGNALFSANLWLKPDGMVEMSDDKAVAGNLPVAVERFDDKGVRVQVEAGRKS